VSEKDLVKQLRWMADADVAWLPISDTQALLNERRIGSRLGSPRNGATSQSWLFAHSGTINSE
jgi:hypothetical protein